MNSFGPFVRALLTLAAAAFPTATMLGVFAQHPDDTVRIVEVLGNLASPLWLYLRKPHPAIENPILDAAHWLKIKLASLCARKVKP